MESAADIDKAETPEEFKARWADIGIEADALRHKYQEAIEYTLKLKMYAAIAAQGVDPDKTKALGFNAELLTAENKRELVQRRIALPARTGAFDNVARRYHNYVKLDTGETVTLWPLIERA